MPKKGTSVISARVQDDIAIKLGEIAQEKGISISKVIEEFVEGYGEPVEEFFHYEETPLGVKIDRKFDRLRERGYPERVIDQMKENILNGIQSQIEMMPRRYDARRSRDYDCGA